mgnify:CR=1 FL=1|tara:strand:+ start:473 stop:712 length:240 start_codon:yes stop_codon:yes gene_type:complete
MILNELLLFSLPIVLISFFALGGAWRYRSEKDIWNNGVCKDNGKEWVLFDMDSQGGRGYRAGNYMCWISWSVDNKRKTP